MTTTEASEATAAQRPTAPERRSALTRAVVPLLLAALLVAGVALLWQARQERQTDHVANHAVVDATATAQVQTAVSQALTRVFSYDTSDPAPTQQAADRLLVGQARREYDLLFAALRKRAAGQAITQTATVQAAAVTALRGDRATLLVFLDQAAQRASDRQAQYSAAQLRIEARRREGVWLISTITTL
jgi:Mce-associated membrane protein